MAKRGKWRGAGKQSVAIFWPNPISSGRGESGGSSSPSVCIFYMQSVKGVKERREKNWRGGWLEEGG